MHNSQQQLILLPQAEADLRLQRLQQAMLAAGLHAGLVTDNANLYRLTGRVFNGWAYIPARGHARWFVRRPVELCGDGLHYLRKPEEIPALLAAEGIDIGPETALELDSLSYAEAMRLARAFGHEKPRNLSPVLAGVNAVKTPFQLDMLRRSGELHTEVYRAIPSLYRPGMTDTELQIEAERLARSRGCLGLFRIAGNSMELFMANILCGDNADAPTPYDFAMGGAGADPSLPVGACGEPLRPGTTVMVDLNGNFTGYMTDMTRVFSIGALAPLAIEAHRCSIDICRMFEQQAVEGASAADLYHRAADMAAERGLERYFMGHRQHSGFVGHGLGVEINELPVIAPRSRHTLEEGNVVALEPKFVIPGTGAVGIENTYIIHRSAPAEKITLAPEEIIPLD